MPDYFKQMTTDIQAAINALEAAAEIVENSINYNDNNNPFHAGAVATYNRLLSMLLDLDRMEV